MANYERGVYEPGDEVRVFDGAEEEDEDIEGSRLPLLIVLALLVLAMFGGVVYLAYTQGVARGRGETPVLTAAAGPEKVAPDSPGGSHVPYQGFKIYEQPAPSDDQADASDNTPAAPQAQVSVQTPVQAPVQAMTAPPPAKPVEKPAPVKAVEAPAAKPIVAMAPPPAKPVEKPATKVAAAATPAIATGAPRPLVSPSTAAPAPAKPTTVAAAPAAGSYVLQIGAYKSQAEADAAWKNYQAKHAALLAGYGENVQQADLGAKGTWYRLRVAGFRDKEGASGVCDRLKADGGACFLGK